MSKLGVVEDTLFIPMQGRIYASEHCPQILYDKKALELKNKLPLDLIKQKSSSWAAAWRQPITVVITERHAGMLWICLM